MKILIIGEKCTDYFVYGRTERLSPEAPVPVFVPIYTTENKGMAGNVSENVKSMCDSCEVIEINQNSDIKKTRYVEKKSNHMFLRVDENDTSEPFVWNLSIGDEIENSDIVIVSDYNKGFLSNEDLIKIGKKSKLSILDSKKKLTSEIVSSFSFVKMNQKEYENNIHLTENENIIITLGEKGCMFKNVMYVSESPKETIDVSGAGDTFTSAFILMYYKSKDIESSLSYANKMASKVVSKRGVATP